MLEQISPLWPILKQHQEANNPLVLVTLVKTSGSSYKKPGAMMLVEKDGTAHGLISGGCLEADVAEHAKKVFINGQAITLTYDMSDDSIFGLGAGCDGILVLVLQLLADDYLPLSAMNPFSKQAGSLTLMINDCEQTGLAIGGFAIKKHKVIESEKGAYEVLKKTLVPLHFRPPPRITVCGAGIDVYPLIQMLQILQWHVQVIDHRRGRLSVPDFSQIKTTLVNPSNLPSNQFNQGSDAVVIMTHNLEHDAAYLEHFGNSEVSWIGLLGPRKRRNKVLELAGIKAEALKHRLHAPVGLNIGGHMPETIAVSIVAQLQQFFTQS